MHPAHVPLVVKAHPVVAGGGGDFQVVGGVLGDVDAGGPPLVEAVVEAAQKVQGPLVDPPGRVPQPVHRPGDGVHPDAVAVVHVHPQGAGAVEEAPHLPPVVVEIAGAPLALAHVAVVLVEAGAVQPGQAGGVGGKVDRHKVHDHPDAHPVAGVDKFGKLGRGAVPAGDGEIPGGLVAPAAVEGVLGQGQQLNMGEMVLLQPGDQLPGQLLIVVPGLGAVPLGLVPPAAGVHLVDAEGQVPAFGAPGHPFPVVKGKIQHRQPAGSAGPQLGGKAIGVGVELDGPVGAGDPVLVAVPLGQPRHKDAPEAGLGPFHGDVPAAGLQLDLPGPGGPEHKLPAFFACRAGGGVGPHPAVGVKTGALPKCLGDFRITHRMLSFGSNCNGSKIQKDCVNFVNQAIFFYQI